MCQYCEMGSRPLRSLREAYCICIFKKLVDHCCYSRVGIIFMATLQRMSARKSSTSPETVGWTNPKSSVNHGPVLVRELACDLDNSSDRLLHRVCHDSPPYAAPGGAWVSVTLLLIEKDEDHQDSSLGGPARSV